ncbi:MAG: DSBA oxidoreductase [Parcubacteria group bacterium GW2011_GWC2_45_7]|nr:MAG: DSBA oxidoreductase [Parcubacteria group bacterium GW2011_GWC2_45_7]KKU74019.1 MAG: DSBA oxidoreductase [Parcubacteria group bacterium GW2011_GWA2_47_26]
MRTPSFIIIVIVALLLAGFVGIVAYYTFIPPDDRDQVTTESDLVTTIALPSRPIIRSTDPVRGDPAGRDQATTESDLVTAIAIVEFGDFFCPSCAEVEATLKSVLEQYSGRVKLVWKDLPNTRLHPLAEKAAQAARCAEEQGKFWEYHDLLFERQTELAETSFIPLAQELRLNTATFEDCLKTERTKDLVARNFNEAILLRVDATPYFFIGERKFSGAIDQNTVNQSIQELLR